MWRGTLTRWATLPSRGVPAPRRIAAAVVSIALAAAPAVAHAQDGAGDEQYTDPFAGQSQPKPKAKPKPQQQQSQPAQQQATPQPSAAAPAQTQQPQPAASSGQLPRTGLDLVPVALVGVALVLAGLALRRRAADGRD
jgi:hypothetical protein